MNIIVVIIKELLFLIRLFIDGFNSSTNLLQISLHIFNIPQTMRCLLDFIDSILYLYQ
jgi:hypothetical protein